MCRIASEKRSALLLWLSLGHAKPLSANGCICLWNGEWLFLHPVPSLMLSLAQVSPHVTGLCVQLVLGCNSNSSPSWGAGWSLVAVWPLVLVLVTWEMRGQLLEWAAWGAWDRSEISWADQKPEMFSWQPWRSLSWFMNYICYMYLAKKAGLHKQGRACGFREPPPTKRYHLECAFCGAIKVPWGTVAKEVQESHTKKCQDILASQHFNGRLSYGKTDPNLDLQQQTCNLPLFHKSLSLELQQIPWGTALPS